MRRYSYVLHQKSGNAGFPLVPDYMADPERPADIWVYGDEFVKGIIELYVDTFFQNEGVGAKLMESAIQN